MYLSNWTDILLDRRNNEKELKDKDLCNIVDISYDVCDDNYFVWCGYMGIF